MQKDIESQRTLETNTTEISAFGCEIGDGAAEILPSQVPQKRKNDRRIDSEKSCRGDPWVFSSLRGTLIRAERRPVLEAGPEV